jgi:hypothetical protein
MIINSSEIQDSAKPPDDPVDDVQERFPVAIDAIDIMDLPFSIEKLLRTKPKGPATIF